MKKLLKAIASIGVPKKRESEVSETVGSASRIDDHRETKAQSDLSSKTPLASGTFADLGLVADLCSAVAEEGYTSPTPIQKAAIPDLLKGRDLLGCAQTGTGKTAAFALPILQRLSQKGAAERGIKALVLTPTRELAIQVADSFHTYGRHLRLKCGVIVGGVGMEPQKVMLRRGVDILVSTPGRLLDLKSQGFVDLSKVSVFVLDEADRMLDMGFIHDVKKIIAELPKQKQNLLFSATMPDEISHLTKSLLHNPITVEVTPVSSTSERIGQVVYFIGRSEKRKLLLALIEEQNIEKAIVFTRTKAIANRVSGFLTDSGISAEAIHGNKSQSARQRALSNFREGKTRILVASDLAARGLDVDLITHVFNYDLPNVPETYVHRIGRTGRADAVGCAISFCDFEERDFLRQIEKLIGKPVPVVANHPWAASGLASPEAEAAANNPGGRSRSGGQRPNPARGRSRGPRDGRSQQSSSGTSGARRSQQAPNSRVRGENSRPK